MRIIIFLLSVPLGNYLGQVFKDVPNWETMFERSFFSIAAVLTYIVYMKVTEND